MIRKKPVNPRFSLVRVSIWTIINHNFLAERIRSYVWTASAIVLFLSVAGFFSLQVALQLLLFCGLGMMILLWSLIQWRKAILQNIRDEELKRTAHAAMLALIHSKQAVVKQARHSTAKNQKRPSQRWLKKNSHL